MYVPPVSDPWNFLPRHLVGWKVVLRGRGRSVHRADGLDRNPDPCRPDCVSGLPDGVDRKAIPAKLVKAPKPTAKKVAAKLAAIRASAQTKRNHLKPCPNRPPSNRP